jgi:phosphomannomutase/phosphoglucomutase
MSIFKAYDIRGRYPEELDEKIARDIGSAFGTLCRGKIAVGYDCRISSPKLKLSLLEGLLSTGREIIDLGSICTPMLAWAVKNYGCDGGVIVTASHLPADYNGFKFLLGNVPVSYESGIKDIESLVRSGKFARGRGKIKEEKGILEDYTSFVLSSFRKERKVKVVVDAGNGSAGIYAKILGRAIDVKELYCEPDGRFPNHEPDPSNEENLHDLQKEVVEQNADIGLAFDGDGDRLGVVDEKGRIVEPQRIFSILIQDALTRHPKGKVVHDVLCSKFIDDVIKKFDGIPVECRVGHTFISQKMVEVDAVLGGEISGHYYFSETNGADDALFASIRLLEAIMESRLPLSELSERYASKYLSYHTRLPIHDEIKFRWVEELREELSNYEISSIDGVKIFFEKGWALIRPSNTEAKVSIAYEASTQEAFQEIKKLVDGIVRRIPK